MENNKSVLFPQSRVSTIDVCELGRKRHHIAALLEVDVTKARALIRKLRQQTGQSISFTAWLTKCIADAVKQYPDAAGYLAGGRRRILFDDVDVSLTVEKQVNGEHIPLPLVIRRADQKEIMDIQQEIRQAQREEANDTTVVLGGGLMRAGTKLFYALPGFLRRFIWNLFFLRPHTAHKLMGSVMVTSVGMFGRTDGWFIPTTIHPLCFAVGSVVKKPAVVGDVIAIREHLKMTVLIDHDVIDGAPAARFMARLESMLSSAYGLDDPGFYTVNSAKETVGDVASMI